jgi:acyl dehydratase
MTYLQEKGYRDYGHDMDNTDTLLECGLGFTCDFEKSREFVGQAHVLEQKRRSKEEGGLRRRMANILLEDPEPLLHHGEVLWRNGERVSYIRAGSYGHTLGGSVGLAMLESSEGITKSFVQEGEWQVEIGNQKYPCRVSLAPFYDPCSLRVKDRSVRSYSSASTTPFNRASSYGFTHSPAQKTPSRSFSSGVGGITGDIPRGGLGIQPGQVAESLRSFSQTDVDAFANITRDNNTLHRDGAETDSTHPLDRGDRKPVVHGMLVATLFSHIFGTLIPGCMYRKQRLVFRLPVHVDDPVVGRIKVLRVRNQDKQTLVRCETQVDLIRGPKRQMCLEGEADVVLPFRSS